MLFVKYHIHVSGLKPNEDKVFRVIYQRVETAKYDLGGISPGNILTVQKDLVHKFSKRFNKYKQVGITLKLLKLEILK